MHELSIVRSLCTQAERLARVHGARRIVKLTLDVGPLSNVVPDLLETAFETYRGLEPMLADAVLEIRRTPLTVACAECGADSDLETFRFRCPRCASPKVRVTRGEELILRDLDLELAEEPSDAGDQDRPDPGEPAGGERRPGSGPA
jgi:hydrogenase nickel incorporation protein HypA/HybF